MKAKSIISAAFAAVLFGFTSCEDMLTTSSTIVMFEEDHELKASTDTVYSVMGIVQKLQKIADRTVLMGELRGDLVSLNSYASSDLQEIANFDFSNPDNAYNKPIDYFSVINNCNYYLSKADTTYKKGTEYVFRYEYGVVLAYRAWAYLRLAEAYGEVPFFTEPILNSVNADASLYPSMNIREVAAALLKDGVMESYFDIYDKKEIEGTMLPNYGSVGDFDSRELFIPMRLIVGELYLWAGGQENFKKAAKCYHDYFSAVNRHVSTGLDRSAWTSKYFTVAELGYGSLFGNTSSQTICYIPMEDSDDKGITSQLDDIFSSTKDNYYFYKATASTALSKLSQSQKFCFVEYNDAGLPIVHYVDPEEMTENLKGDLRLISILSLDNDIEDEKLTDDYYTSKQTNSKINPVKVCMYRKDVVYLRFAEALNYAGFPESAFAVLKYGLCEKNINAYINEFEREAAKEGGMNLLDFSNQYFTPYAVDPVTGQEDRNRNTQGIHSRGCGIASMDTTYCLKNVLSEEKLAECETRADSVAYWKEVAKLQQAEVEQLLVDELALETCFEGNRFGDLIRFSMHRMDIKNGGVNVKMTDNQFVADRVAYRNGQLDQNLWNKLVGDGTSFNSDWFMKLPE